MTPGGLSVSVAAGPELQMGMSAFVIRALEDTGHTPLRFSQRRRHLRFSLAQFLPPQWPCMTPKGLPAQEEKVSLVQE